MLNKNERIMLRVAFTITIHDQLVAGVPEEAAECFDLPRLQILHLTASVFACLSFQKFVELHN